MRGLTEPHDVDGAQLLITAFATGSHTAFGSRLIRSATPCTVGPVRFPSTCRESLAMVRTTALLATTGQRSNFRMKTHGIGHCTTVVRGRTVGSARLIRAICPTRGAGQTPMRLTTALSNHLHGFDLHDWRTQHLRIGRRPVFRRWRTWLLYRPGHLHLFVDVGRQLGLR